MGNREPQPRSGDPVDIIGDAPPNRYADALKILLEASETDTVLVINCPTAIASSIDAAQAVAAQAAASRKNILANWLGAHDQARARRIFESASIPAYGTPTEALRGFGHLVQYRRGQEIIIEAPSSSGAEVPLDRSAARQIVAEAVTAGGTWLTPMEVQRLLTCYRIPSPRAAFASTPAEAGQKAAEIGGPVALKIMSNDVLHKSDAGGVALNLNGVSAVTKAAEGMLARVTEKVPSATIAGFLVQEMIAKPSAFELILGASVDPQFGPVLLFGHGGTAVEAINDKALGLPPLNQRLALELIGQTRIAGLLRGYRDHLPAALDDIAATLVKLSQLICDLDEVVEVDLNPLLADATGVIALDARIRVAAAERRGARLAILPYPRDLEAEVVIPSVGALLLRPIKPDDAERLEQLVSKSSPHDLRMRFFGPVQKLNPPLLARLTQIDYDREIAFVVARKDQPDSLIAVARLIADPDNVRAEFAILVRTDFQRRGIGRMLMQQLIDNAKARGLSELVGDVLAENTTMRDLCTQLGFKSAWGGAQDTLLVNLKLR